MTPVDLAPLFAPRRVALLGVSRSPEKLGHRLLKNLLEGGFPGEILPVNPSGEPILGMPSVPRAADLPAGLDLALVSLPAAAVVPALRELAARGCRVTVVLASGFGETGEGGRAVQAELAAIARASGMRIVGPNCMGVVNVPGRVNGSYFWDVPKQPGGITFVSQSGAFGGLFFREARARGLGVAKFLSIGNQTDLGFAECLSWLTGDADTRVVALFVEGVRDGAAFVEAAGRLAEGKPVVAFKAGRGGAGQRAAASHTGALAGAHEAYRAAFRRAGIVAVEDSEEFFDAVAVLDAHAARPPREATLAILTVSGGPSVAAADAAEPAGLRVPPLPEPVRGALRAYLPAFGAVGNPVDMTPQIAPAGFGPAIRTVLASDAVAGALAIDVGLDVPAFADAVTEAQAATGKPIVACTADTPEVDARLRGGGVPILPSPERAVRAYRALAAYGARRPRPEIARRPARALPPAVTAALARGTGPLPPATARALLEHYDVAFPAEAMAESVDDAVAAARQIGFPVVVKTAAPGVTHKSEAGGVVLDVADEAALRAAHRALAARFGSAPVLVQARVPAGLELLVGARRDPTFGTTVVVGLGGVLAELWRDVSVRLAPLDEAEARAMLAEGQRAELLRGFRGAPACDEAGLARVVVAVGDLLVDRPEIAELDVNPLIVRGAEAVAVDVLVIVDRPVDGGGAHA